MDKFNPKGLQTEISVYALQVYNGEDPTQLHCPEIVYIVRDDGRPLECLFVTDEDWANVDSRNHFWPKVITVGRVGVTPGEYARFETLATRAQRDTLDMIIDDDLRKLIDGYCF